MASLVLKLAVALDGFAAPPTGPRRRSPAETCSPAAGHGPPTSSPRTRDRARQVPRRYTPSGSVRYGVPLVVSTSPSMS